MTEEEIEANALDDLDNPPMTAGELVGTLRDWEQGAAYPDKSARTLLHVIEQDPEAVARALARSYLPKPKAAR